jgi:hypothetical protein
VRLPRLVVLFALGVSVGSVHADGKIVGPRGYRGSLEELSQEAIIIFEGGDENREALEHLILKIGVKGQTDHFAWVVPFPKEPKVEKEDARLFEELFDYVAWRNHDRKRATGTDTKTTTKTETKSEGAMPVEVLSRKIVGKYDVAIVRENEAGALNKWLKDEGYETLPDDAEDVLGFYREKKYVFACIKVADTGLSTKKEADLHPLRFTFHTGGRDGIYFPMKMTGLQKDPFNVNLYVFYRYWLNDDRSKFGYVHRGFRLRYRDWDTDSCEPNGGKDWSNTRRDPYFSDAWLRLDTVPSLLGKLVPDERFYLTNIYANNLRPSSVRGWSDDLWLFPYQDDSDWVPYDVREGGVAEAVYPDVPSDAALWFFSWGWTIPAALAVALVLFYVRRRVIAARRFTLSEPGTD